MSDGERSAALRITWLGGNCPVQAEGFVGQEAFYFRARGNRWSMSIGGADPVDSPDWSYEEPDNRPGSAGWMSEEDARRCIEKAAALFLAAHREVDA